MANVNKPMKIVLCNDPALNKTDCIYALTNLNRTNPYITLRNMSKTSASVSSRVPNTEKQMKARGHRSSAFIVSRCLEP